MPRPLIMESQALLNGVRRDAEGEGIYLSFRTLENLDVLRDPLPLLSVRLGYTRWNSTALAGKPRQVFSFRPSSGLEYVIAYLDTNDIYLAAAAAAHTRFYLGSANMPLRIPFLTVGNRLFWGTHTIGGIKGFYWSDAYAMALGNSAPVGIDALTVSGVTTSSIERPINDISDNQYDLNDSVTNVALAQTFALTVPHLIDGVRLQMVKTGTPKGSFRISIQTTSGGLPSGTLYANTTSITFQSDWIDVASVPSPVNWLDVRFHKTALIDSVDTLAVVVETDAIYKANFSGTNKISWRAAVGTNPYPSGNVVNYNGATWSAVALDDMAVMLGTGLNEGALYQYQIVGWNDTYKIEGAFATNPIFQSTASGTGRQGIQFTGITNINPEIQVEELRFYRTYGGATQYYHLMDWLVSAADTANTYVDCVGDTSLTLRASNFLIQPLQDEDENRLAPNHLAHWNNRIWASVPNSDILYFSAQVEEQNALGIAGDPLYDVFPANNNWKFYLGEPITGLYNFYDRLVVTFRSHIRVLHGGDSPLNPPDNLYMEEAINLEGCADGYSLDEVLGKLIFVNQHNEVKAYRGGPVTLDVNDFNISLWEGLTGPFDAKNIGNQYWCLASRGGSSEIWIYNASTESPRWTVYKYNTNLNGLGILSDGTVLGCDANSNYLLRLNNGTTDNGALITSIAETHPVPSQNPRGRSRWNRVLISAFYPSVIPTVTMQGIDRLGSIQGKTITPAGSEGPREHWTGLRIFSEQCAARITMVGQSLNQIRRIWLGSTRQNL